MSERFPENLKSKIFERLAFYEDLGINLFYRERRVSTDGPAIVESATVMAAPETAEPPAAKEITAHEGSPLPKPVAKSHAPAVVASVKTSSFFEQLDRVPDDTLLRIREDIGDCRRCKLHRKRNHIVFADGNPKAELVFVGEGPGADEDATGIPFVGRAGKLLTQMIQAMGLQREDVYICNVVKCRPPENRQPDPEEVTTCSPYLVRQLEVVNPKVIVCLGATAAQTLLETTTGISKFRGQWQDFRGRKLLATYHPAYLLRNPAAKGEVWKDLQKVMGELGLAVKKTKPV
jgi:DNA polymerase